MTTLDVYLEAVHAPIGKLSSDASGNITFRYLSTDLPHPVSASLPLQDAPFDDVASRGYFANLLFENEMRDQVMQRYGIAEGDIVALLYHLGTDCPGAISCVPEGAAPAKRPGDLAQDYRALDGSPVLPADLTTCATDPQPIPTDSALGRIMASLRDRRRLPADGIQDPSPLAGVQGKIALTRLPDGRLGLPNPDSGAPTTHILKVPRADAMHSVIYEHLAMHMMATVQPHPVAATCIIGTGDMRGLLIERFDRQIDGTAVHRIHQEDFCQALGLGHRLKYQRDGEGERRFDAAAIGHLLNQTAQPGKARLAMFQITIANLILGNSDNHAKNHALLYRGPRPELAPAYDIDPVLLYEVLHQLSFDIGQAQMADEVTTDDLDHLCKALGFRGLTQPLRREIITMITTLVEVSTTLPRPVGKRLADVVGQQAQHVSDNLKLNLGPFDFDAVPVTRP